jgi:hypothetical protein
VVSPVALKDLVIRKVKMPPDVARAALKFQTWAKTNGYRVLVLKEPK